MKNGTLLILMFAIVASVQAQSLSRCSMAVIPYTLEWMNTPLHYELGANSLQITAGKNTNMFRSPAGDFNVQNAPMLLFQPQTDFDLTATLEVGFDGHWDAGALVLYNDSMNWMKMCFEKDYTNRIRVVTVVTHNISDDCNSMLIPGNRVKFRLVKGGDVVVLYYAEEGKDWFVVRHFNFKTEPGFQVGFLAQAPVVDSCTVRFEDVRYAEQKGLNPYQGINF